MVAVELPFIPKVINCMHQTMITYLVEREHSILLSVTHKLYVYQVCYDVGHCIKDGSCFFVKPGVKVNGQYWWDILLSQEMLDAAKHIRDNIFFFQEDSALLHMHCACNTVQVLRLSQLRCS